MKTLKFLLLISLLAVLGCQEQKGVSINGTIENAANLSVHLDKKSMDNNINSVMNTTIDETGNFQLDLLEGIEPGLYRVRIGNRGVDLVMTGTEKNVTLTGNLSGLSTLGYKVTGSSLSEMFQQKVKAFRDKKLPKKELDTYINDEASPLLAMAIHFATTPASPDNFNLYKKMAANVAETYPTASIGQQFKQFAIDMELENKKIASRYKVRVGQPAPNISLPDVDGNTRSLSDLKGKVVLLDFWASWCGPCRRSNPHVVELYHKYNKEGFEVFNVSLDGIDSRTAARYKPSEIEKQLAKEKRKWREAIAKDKLVWNHHVSDLKKWESSGAATYGVKSIPTTFLIGRDGKIAALNPKSNLEEKIKQFI